MTDTPGSPSIGPAFPDYPRFVIGDGLRWAWRTFTRRLDVILPAVILWALVLITVSVVIGILAAGLVLDSSDTSEVPLWVTVLINALSAVLGAVALSCWLNALITLADGRPATLGTFFTPRALGAILLITVLQVAVGTVVTAATGDIALVGDTVYLGDVVTMILGLLMFWCFLAAADLQLPGVQALAYGIDLAVKHPLRTLGAIVVSFLLAVAGILALIIGLAVALPVAGLMEVYLFRSLTGPRPVQLQP